MKEDISRGIVLDFNGTLVWDTELHKLAWLELSKELSSPMTEEYYYQEVHGRTTKNILEILKGGHLSPEELEELGQEKERLYREACIQRPDIWKLAPWVEDFLNHITELDIPRTIATASEKVNLDFFISHFSLDQWFDTELFVYDDGCIKNKPEPDIYLKAAEHLGMEPQELAVVEDSYYGFLAAKRGGLGRIIITGPPEDQHRELAACEGIHQFIQHFDEIDRESFNSCTVF